MKKSFFMFLLFAGVTIFTSCKKEEAAPSLELTVRDNLGNAVSGATLKLFKSENDLINFTNQVGSTKTTDGSGKIKIENLEEIKYYFFAEKDCYNNYRGGNYLVDPLKKNQNTTADIVISKTGTLKVMNNSAHPYKIYINGAEETQIPAGNYYEKKYMAIGSYVIRYVQVSGFTSTPIDADNSGTLDCGGTFTTTIN
jgi:hypothetical protein